MNDQLTLERNIDSLGKAYGEVLVEFMRNEPMEHWHRFLRLILLEVADRMSPQQLEAAIQAASEQLRRPA